VSGDRTEPEVGKRSKHGSIVLFLRDAGVAALFVACILLAMFAYTGQWPPLVVVESNSMMHSEENLSKIGAIDTGDMVLVKKVASPDDIVTYVEGASTGHRTYGEYGDVIVYKVYGQDIQTPIIHRAMMYLVVNPDGRSYRCEALKDLPPEKWYSSNAGDAWDSLTGVLVVNDTDYMGRPLTVDIGHLPKPLRSGYVTKGDHNSMIDSSVPVSFDWIVGKARGEIPWFGLLKLWSTGTLGSPEPANSVRNLWISIGVIVVAPVVVDIMLTYREKRMVTLEREHGAEPGVEGAPSEEDEKDGG